MHYTMISDSGCDTPEVDVLPTLVRVPLQIELDEKFLVADESLDPDKLLEAIGVSQTGPKSACPSPGDFLERYQAAEGDIYVVTLSSEISGTYNSAVQAREIFMEENPGRNLHVFNSKSAAAGELLICAKIAELAQAGQPFDEVVAAVETAISEMQTMFVLEDLEILRKNGRLSKVQSVVTGALRIKLVMGATAEGTIQKVTSALSTTQALNKMITVLCEHVQKMSEGKIERLVITHCAAKERAEYIRDKVKETVNVKETIICKAGGISTMYANRGGVVVSFC